MYLRQKWWKNALENWSNSTSHFSGRQLNSRMSFWTERRDSHANSRSLLKKKKKKKEEEEVRRKRKRRSRRQCKKASKRESDRQSRHNCLARFCDCIRGRVSEELRVCECASSHGIPSSHDECRCVGANVYVENDIPFVLCARDRDQLRITERHVASRLRYK